VAGGEEQRVMEAPHRGYWGDFAVTDSGLYLVDSEAKPSPAIIYYNLQTHRLTPVLTLKQELEMWVPNFAASRDGRTVLFGQHEQRTSLVMVEYLR
jgi:hypothetical protein